jgi:hypothetical protein
MMEHPEGEEVSVVSELVLAGVPTQMSGVCEVAHRIQTFEKRLTELRVFERLHLIVEQRVPNAHQLEEFSGKLLAGQMRQ